MHEERSGRQGVMVFENAARRLASILDGIWKTLAVAAVIGLLGQPAAAERVLRLTLQLPITPGGLEIALAIKVPTG